MKLRILHSFLLSLTYSCLFPQISKPQINPDQSLPKNSTITKTLNQVTISDGTTQGNNLFHSFREFDVPSGNIVQFNNSSLIKNIITRVTGSRTSNIDGSILVNGNSNLFFLNKNGIGFGPNASLNLNGSFLASTANSILFENGFQFGSQNIENSSLLPTSFPSQLLFTDNQSSIQVNGNGGFVDLSTFLTKLKPSALVKGLQTVPGQSLNIVGGKIILDGGLLAVSQSLINIGAVRSGTVDITNTSLGPTLGFKSNSTYGDISVSNESLINVTESIASLRGNIIDIGTGSIIFSNSFGNNKEFSINLTGNLIRFFNTPLTSGVPTIQTPIGPDLDLFGSEIQTGINTQTVGPAKGTSVNLSANIIELSTKTGIASSSFQNGKGGDIKVSAKDINFIGLPASFDPLITTNTFGNGPSGNIQINARNLSLGSGQIISVSFGPQDSGDISVKADNISIENGTSISTITFAQSDLFDAGNSGDINISADKIRVVGDSPIDFTNSSISASTFGDGNGGQVSIFSKDIFILDGGVINASTRADGNSGGVVISTDNVFLSGRGLFTGDSSQIASSAELIPLERRQLLNLPNTVNGFSGDVSIKANNLVVKSGAEISTKNQGVRDGGQLILDIGNISVSDGGSLTSSTTSSNGGSIQLRANQLLLNDGKILASTSGNGTGGNIDINAKLFVGFGENDISANAINDRGGNISFNTFGFFPSPDTEITATSALGAQFDGNVIFNNPDTDLELGITALETELSKPEISSICRPTSADTYSEFIATGEGGLPTGASDSLSGTTGWHDSSGGDQQSSINNQPVEVVHIDDAQGWVTNPDGTMSLVAEANLPINKADTSKACNAQTPRPSPASTVTHPHTTSNSPSPLSTRSDSTEAKASSLVPSR